MISDHPWELEQDVNYFCFEGYDCLVIRHRDFGHLSGYVRLSMTYPEGPLADPLLPPFALLSPHKGEVTYIGPLENEVGVWVGFSCCRYDDLSPYLYKGHTFPRFRTYRTMEYVVSELKELVLQIISLNITPSQLFPCKRSYEYRMDYLPGYQSSLNTCC